MPGFEPTDVLLIGDVASSRFAGVLHELPFESALPCELPSRKHARGAIEWLDETCASPTLVLIYQSYPDEYPREDVERLIGRMPLSRVVVVFGPWCESIGRTEQVWPIGWCVPLGHAPTRLKREIDGIARNESPLPATTSRDEAFAASAASAFGLAGRRPVERVLTARVTGTDRVFADCVRETLAAFGFRVVSESIVESATAVDVDFEVVVISLADAWAIDLVARCRARSPATRLVVASDLATPDDINALRKAGADRVIGQLRFAEEMAAVIVAPSVDAESA